MQEWGHHDHGSRASAALAVLLRNRLAHAGFPNVRVRPHELGLQLEALIGSAPDAARFVTECTRALSAPLAPDGKEAAAITDALAAISIPTWSSASESAVAACSGELGTPAGGHSPSPAVTAPELESWRRDVYSTRSVAFAALGAPAVLEAATDARSTTRCWTRQCTCWRSTRP